MAFSDMATTTISTKRSGVVTAGKRAVPATNLQGVSVFPIMPITELARDDVRWRAGLEGQSIQMHETFTESHEHTDGGVIVTQVPDIQEGDILIDESTEYVVRFVGSWPTTDLTGFLRIALEENKT